MLSISTALANGLLTTDCFKALMDGGKLTIFNATGGIPANADAATSATVLAVLTATGSGTGLTFATPAVNGVISKTVSEIWECLAADVVTGTAAFYRFCKSGDAGTGAAGSTDYRVQGTVGTDISYDMIVPTTTLTNGVTFGPMTTFQIQLLRT
jgi:hypothetical protein